MLFRAKSIKQLTIIGFMTVAALLILALLVTARQLDWQTEQGQSTVAGVATAMSASRRLIEQTRAMERNALQYLVLRDDSLFEVYHNRREEFHSAVAQLRLLNTGSDMTQLANTIVDAENSAYELLRDTPDRARVESAYSILSDRTSDLSYLIELWILQQQSQLAANSENTRQSLTWQALLFIAAASGLAALFIVLITRPLQQIDKAINRLGSGAYEKPVVVSGPKDLQSLGLRLDWLRGRLTELEQQRTSFLRHISHELKTPLASMQEGAALLDEGVVGPLSDEQREVSRIIVSNCQRLQNLVENVLRHNSQNFEVLNAMPEPVQFDETIEAVVAAHQWPVTSNRIKVHRELAKLEVLTDPERLRVIVDNLFTNALKFSPADGVIALRLYTQKDTAIFEIADEGPGIPQDEWHKIFTAFYQGSIKPHRSYNGSGLGLAIAREYALATGGSIELCETGKGACFKLILPLVKKQAETMPTGN